MAEIKERTRSIARMTHDSLKKVDFRMKAIGRLQPSGPLWGVPRDVVGAQRIRLLEALLGPTAGM